METRNGTSEKNIGRGYDDLRCANEQRPLGEFGQDSEGAGSRQPCGFTENDSQWTDTSWKLVPIRDTTAGKIFQRLEIIEAQYLNYVQSHQDRLKARLGESELSKEEFLRESNQIKSDIYHLAMAQNGNVNGNGHQ